MTAPTMRPLSFGEILDGAFTLYRRNFVRFVGTSVLLMAGFIAAIVFLAVTGVYAASVMPGPLQMLVLAVICVAVVALASMLWSTLTWQAARSYQGKRAPLGDALDAAFEGAMTVLGAGVVAAAVVAGVFYASSMAADALAVVVDGFGSPALSLAARVAGGLGVLAAGMLALSLFFGVLPAVMVEELGPWDAVVRSVRLARGALARIAGVLFVAWLIVTLPTLAVMALTGGFAVLASAGGAELGTVGVTALIAQQLLTLLVGIVTLPYQMAVMVLLYYDRRVRLEALDVEIVAGSLELAGT